LAPPYLTAIWAGGRMFRFASDAVFRHATLAVVSLIGIAALIV
jgi:hypothetical protein